MTLCIIATKILLGLTRMTTLCTHKQCVNHVTNVGMITSDDTLVGQINYQ